MPFVCHEIKEMISFYKVDNWEYKSQKALIEEKNYLKAIKYSTKFIVKAIDKYGKYDSVTLEKFHNAYSTYKLTIPKAYTFGYRTTYNDNLKIVHNWRSLLYVLEDKYGSGYVDSLYHYTYTVGSYGIDSYHEAIPYSAMSYRDELLVNVFNKHLNTIDVCSKSLYEELDKRNVDLDNINTFLLISEIAEEIERQDYLDHAYNYMLDYYEKIPKNKYSEVIEKLNTELGLLTWRAGNANELSKYVQNVTLLSPNENGIEYCKSFYDINDLLRQLILLSRYYELCGDYENRAVYLSIAKQIVDGEFKCQNKEPLNNTTKAMFYSEYGVEALYNEDYIEAEKYLELVPQIDSIWTYTNTANLAYAYIKNGKYDESRNIIKQYYDNSLGLLLDTTNLALLDCQIELAIHDNNSSLALELLERKLKIVENDFYLKSLHLSNSSRTNYWDYKYSRTLESFTTNAYRVDSLSAGVAYDAALFQKGILNRIQSIIQRNIAQSNDEQLIKLYKDYSKAKLKGSSSLAQLEKKYIYAYSQHNEFDNATYVTRWSDIQKELKDGELVIEFTMIYDTTIVGNYYLGAIILNKHMSSPKIVKLYSRHSIVEYLINTRQDNGYPIAYDEFDNKGNNKLYKMIWEPLESELEGIETIYYSPYDFLYKISLEALRKDINSQYLFQSYNLVRLSSSEEIIKDGKKAISTAVLYGNIDYDNFGVSSGSVLKNDIVKDREYNNLRSLHGKWEPLIETKSEVDSISTLLSIHNINNDIYTTTRGSEESFKLLSSKPIQLIHLATHGFYFKEEETQGIDFFNRYNDVGAVSSGYRSGLIFSGANRAWKDGIVEEGRDDGILTSDEIMGMDLSSTDLLVLSTCQSALGDTERDGIYGIQRSFKIAGVNTMMMSLWQVDDEATSLLMKSFYTHYLEDLDKRDAFKKAQSEVMEYYKNRARTQSINLPKYKRYDSSFYWAAFVMVD